jgi:predicted ATPase
MLGRYDPIVIDIPKGTYVPKFGPSPRDSAVAAAAATSERLIVGRHKELTELRASFGLAVGGRGQLFCLTGEPGIGKTTVVETFLRELETSAAGCYVARGRCSERLAGREAYLPVLETLESLVRGGEESVGRLMIAVAPTWYLQIAPATADYSADRIHTAGKVVSQERLKRELVAFIEELARRQPVVLFLDDLQWADASTVDILAYAAARCISLRILIVAPTVPRTY